MRWWLVILLLLLGVARAMAAEVAERRIYGFSQDGAWFAFAEYGVNDGSGAPYATIYILDVLRDRWAKGTPVKVHFMERPGPPMVALQEAEKRAARLFARYGIAGWGRVLASRAAAEAGGDPRRLAFFPHPLQRNAEDREAFTLREIDFPDSERCRQWGIDEKGFVLHFSRDGMDFGEIYRDARVPTSRLCPAYYELADVVRYAPPTGKPRYVVLVRYYRMGFEGLDGRYLAVPTLLH